MRTKNKVFALWLLALTLVLSVVAFPSKVYASSYDTLKINCQTGSYPTDGKQHTDLPAKSYKRSGGDFYYYTEISGAGEQAIINETKFNQLTAGAKQEFLKDFIDVAYAWEAYFDEYGAGTDGEMITGETVSDLMYELQQVSGAGSQIMAALLSDVKADYATADRIFSPFSGPIKTGIGLICIAIMAFLGLTMALDIAYITIPAFQLALDGDSGGEGQGVKGMAKIISPEARSAAKEAENGGGAGGQSGSSKRTATGAYMKVRWKGLVLLGICLVYLVQGQIYTLVAWIIDLFSGFLGF